LGSSAARNLHGLFLCPATIPAVQPREPIVMVGSNPAMDFDNGKWAAVFHARMSKNIVT